MFGIIGSLYFLIQQLQLGINQTAFSDLLYIDPMSIYARILVALSSLVILLFINNYISNHPQVKKGVDIYSIVLAAILGLYLLASSTHWLLIFIAIETISISSYILVSYFATEKKQSEAAMKYALFGSICAAVMLYGLSLIYGFTGNLDFTSQKHLNGLAAAPELISSIALLFIMTGIGFKLSFFPFHVWAPDVYQGAPTPITAFLSTVPKISALILLARLVQSWTISPFFYSELVINGLSLVAIATMLVGNMVALRQKDIKRMMAYSSIGHTGILLMAVLVYMQDDPSILLFYITIYTIMNLAVFIYIDILERQLGNTNISSLQGLGKKQPLLFVSFSFVLISLVGLPPTAGFVGKLIVFSKVFETYQSTGYALYLLLLIVGALTAVISLFFYLKIPRAAFLQDSATEIQQKKKSSYSALFIIALIGSILIFIWGIFPSLLLTLFQR